MLFTDTNALKVIHWRFWRMEKTGECVESEQMDKNVNKRMEQVERSHVTQYKHQRLQVITDSSYGWNNSRAMTKRLENGDNGK